MVMGEMIELEEITFVMVETKFKVGGRRSYALSTREAGDFVNRVMNGPDRRKISSIVISSRGKSEVVTIRYARDGNQSVFPTYFEAGSTANTLRNPESRRE